MSWDDLAAGWERWSVLTSDSSAPVDRWFLDALDPRPGQTVLDIGAGTGEAGFLVAERVAPDGAVLIADLSGAMVEAARRRARQQGHANVTAVVMDAQNLELADRAVDAVLCRWTLHLLADPNRALREMARVVRSRGRVAVSVWAEAERNPLVPLLAEQLVRRGHIEPPPGNGTTIEPAAVLRSAGLEPVRVEEVTFDWAFSSAAEAFRYVADTGGAFARALRRLPEDRHAEVRAAYADALSAAGHVAEDGTVTVPAVAVNALAVRPC